MSTPLGPLDFSTFFNAIDGTLVSTDKTRHGINPASGQPNPEVPVATQADVDSAVEAASKAFKKWSKVPWSERQKAVLAFADAFEKEKEGFTRLLVQEQGKPAHWANFEFDFAVRTLRDIAMLELPTEEINEPDRKIKVRYTPLGVTVGIVPWNYPVLLCCAKIAPCLITGNTIIIKPSPFTPYGGLKVVELAQRFFPPGVIQALSGDDSLGPMLTAHPGVAKISFTGSTATGKKVMQSASRTLKRVTLELGGNDPAIICDDVDIDPVAEKVARFAFMNSGQLCLAIKRIYVQSTIFDKFREALIKHTRALKLGEGNEQGVFLGPVQNAMQYERVKGFFDDIEKQDWNIAVGGVNPDGPGYFITPTIIDRPKPDARIVVEEPFGPIVPLLSFETDEEAIQKANDTSYGLGASVWCRDIERASKIADELQAGSVWVNTHYELDPRVPFGGFKESGIGLEWGIGGLKGYCNSQTVYVRE